LESEGSTGQAKASPLTLLLDGNGAPLPLPEGVTAALGRNSKTNTSNKQEMWRSLAEISSM